MGTYILKRLLLIFPMIFGITLISFAVMQLAPGKPGGTTGGSARSNKMTQQQYEVMNRTFHLNQPIYVRYFYWLGIAQEPPTDQDKLAALTVLEEQWKDKVAEKQLEADARRARELGGALFADGPINAGDLRATIDEKDMPPHPTLADVRIPKTGILFGDFGNSMEVHSVKVWDLLADAIPITIMLNLLTFLLMYSFSIPMGIYSATHQNSAVDRVTTVGLFFLYSLPSFWVAVLLIKLVVSMPKAWRLPIQGIQPDDSSDLTTLAWLWSCSKHLLLPLLVFTYGSFAATSRYMRSGMIGEIRSDYVRTARAKGLREFFVVYKHALRNSLIPIITLLGSELPALIGGSIIIEAIFGIPGMGNVGYKALLSRDYTVLMADLTLVSVLVMIGFIVSDILYKVADPRISFEGRAK